MRRQLVPQRAAAAISQRYTAITTSIIIIITLSSTTRRQTLHFITDRDSSRAQQNTRPVHTARRDDG